MNDIYYIILFMMTTINLILALISFYLKYLSKKNREAKRQRDQYYDIHS